MDNKLYQQTLAGFGDYCKSKGHLNYFPIEERARNFLENTVFTYNGMFFIESSGIPIDLTLDDITEDIFRHARNPKVKDALWYRLLRDFTLEQAEERMDHEDYTAIVRRFFPHGNETPAPQEFRQIINHTIGNKSARNARYSKTKRGHSSQPVQK